MLRFLKVSEYIKYVWKGVGMYDLSQDVECVYGLWKQLTAYGIYVLNMSDAPKTAVNSFTCFYISIFYKGSIEISNDPLKFLNCPFMGPIVILGQQYPCSFTVHFLF